MKYFTPELYVRFNSPDEEVADQANEEWERATERYDQRWEEIKDQLPRSVLQFCDEECLHDADVFAPARVLAAAQNGVADDVVLVAQQINTLNPGSKDTLAFLYYSVTEEPRVDIPVCSEVFNRAQPLWAYDEFDLVGPGVFSHAIFFTDGRVVTIHFRDFHYHTARLIGAEVFRDPRPLTPAKAASS